MKTCKKLLAAFMALLMLSALCVMPASAEENLSADELKDKLEYEREDEISPPMFRLPNGMTGYYDAVKDPETGEISYVFPEYVPEIRGNSTGVTAVGTPRPDLRSATSDTSNVPQEEINYIFDTSHVAETEDNVNYEQEQENEVSPPMFRLPNGMTGYYDAVKDPETGEISYVFPDYVPEIRGNSTGVTAVGTPRPDLRSATSDTGNLDELEKAGVDSRIISDSVKVYAGPKDVPAQLGYGAHYYDYSVYGTSYTSAFANIKLPTGFNHANHARNAFISLGIHGGAHGIDLGIVNEGNGWYPVYYDVGVKYETFSSYKAPSNATNALITVQPVSTTAVHLYVQFTDSSGNYVGTPFDSDLTVAAGNLTRASNGRFNCKFYRFASFVPTGTDNLSDGSYMTGGKLMYCQLYNGSSYVNWGIKDSTTASAWSVYPNKITLTYSGSTDTFNIRHS